MKLSLLQLWSLLPIDTRRKMIAERKITRSGNVEVDSVKGIINDGIREGDLNGKIEDKEIEEMLGINKNDVSIKEVKEIKKKKDVKKPNKDNENKDKKQNTEKTI